jgi:hypothetical protein
MKTDMQPLLAVLAFVAMPALAQVEVHDAWSRATAPGARIAAGYMVLLNKAAAPDRLIGASSPSAERVETHVHIRDGDVMRMREVKGYDIPAGGSFELEPGGAHLMLVNIKAPFKDGQRIPLLLRFERAGTVRTELAVGRPAPPGDHKH